MIPAPDAAPARVLPGEPGREDLRDRAPAGPPPQTRNNGPAGAVIIPIVETKAEFAERVKPHLDSLYRTALRMTGEASAAEDLVQETFLKAHREFHQFAGSTEPELVAWLRKILVNTLANQAKHHTAQGRDYRRQQSLEALLDRSSLAVQRALARPISSPSAQAVRREQAVLLADALEHLPAHYREVFILRNLEHLPFPTIAQRMGRSLDAVQVLWKRAMDRLITMLRERS